MRRREMTAWGPGLPPCLRFTGRSDALLARYGARLHALAERRVAPQTPNERRFVDDLRHHVLTGQCSRHWARYQRRFRLAELIRDMIRRLGGASLDRDTTRELAIALANTSHADPALVDLAIIEIAREMDVVVARAECEPIQS